MADARYKSAYKGTEIDGAVAKVVAQLDNTKKLSELLAEIEENADDISGLSTSKAAKSTSQYVTLNADSWSSNSQTVSASGVTASNNVMVSPKTKDDATAWGDSEVFCSAQGNGTLTFTCTDAPTGNISVSVVILG